MFQITFKLFFIPLHLEKRNSYVYFCCCCCACILLCWLAQVLSKPVRFFFLYYFKRFVFICVVVCVTQCIYTSVCLSVCVSVLCDCYSYFIFLVHTFFPTRNESKLCLEFFFLLLVFLFVGAELGIPTKANW